MDTFKISLILRPDSPSLIHPVLLTLRTNNNQNQQQHRCISQPCIMSSVPPPVSHLYTVYSLGAEEDGSLMFLLPKFPFHRTESLRTTMADTAGSLVAWTLVLRSPSTYLETLRVIRDD